MPVCRVVKLDEVSKTLVPQRTGLEGEVLVGAQVVNSQLFSPRCLTGSFAFKEHHIGLHALCVNQTSRQSKDGVHITLVQQLFADYLSCTALKQHVIRQHHCRAAILLQQGFGVLHKVELVVAGGGPKSSRSITSFSVVTLPSALVIMVLFLLARQVGVVVSHMVVRCKQKATGAAGWVTHRFTRLGRNTVDHGLYQRTRREVLPRPALGVLCVFLQQAFEGIPLSVCAHS